IGRRILTKLTSGPDLESYPVWTPDSRFVVFRSGPQGGQTDVYRRAADGTGALERLTDTPEAEAPQMVLADGRRVLARRAATDTAPLGSLDLLELTPGAPAVPLFARPPATMTSAEISPDGRWIAYQSPEGSTFGEVHVRPFPDVEAGRWQISSGGGTRPMWSRSAQDMELFYVASGAPPRLMRVPVEPARAGAFVHGVPEPLFTLTDFTLGAIGRAFDLSADSRRFLMVAPVTSDSERNRRVLMFVTHWTDELRARVPAGK
ncbi:MAG TPA: hypothetical protein VMM93_01300, partial [Vicinamibacterales bacterium]|nr:hypothetical protein [Vicinamibacterales bacterium]